MLQNIVTFFTQSSDNPEKTSATLSGILLMGASWLSQYATAIPVIHSFFASPLGQQVDPAIQAISMIGGGILALFGLFRKLTNKVEATVVK